MRARVRRNARLLYQGEVRRQRLAARAASIAISDDVARTIASWWQTPAPEFSEITRLSHRLEFDVDLLREQIGREITEETDRLTLLSWLDAVEAREAREENP